MALSVVLAFSGSISLAVADESGCVVSYLRTACKGMDAESFKKCDGQAACDKTKEAASDVACREVALKSCDNDRIDITKYKRITAQYNGAALVGGFDDNGNADPAGANFCDAQRPDMNKCE